MGSFLLKYVVYSLKNLLFYHKKNNLYFKLDLGEIASLIVIKCP